MTRIRSLLRRLVVASIGLTAILAVTAPAGAITGGTEDTNNTHSNVGFWSSTSRTVGSDARAR